MTQDRREYMHQWYLAHRKIQPEWKRCAYCDQPILASGRRLYCNPNHRLKAFRQKAREQKGNDDE